MARIRARALAPLAGVVYVGLMVAVLSLPSSPDSKAGGAKLITFYREHHTSTRVSEFMLAYAAIAVVVFFASLATYLRQRGAQVLASTTVAGAVVMAAGLCLAAGVTEAGVDQYKRLSDSAAQTLNLLQNDAFAILLFAGLALAVTSAGVSMLLTKAMHKAIGIITVVIGVAAATGFASWIGFMASGLLTLFLAVYLFREYNRPDAITLPEVAASAQVPAQATAETEQPTTAQPVVDCVGGRSKTRGMSMYFVVLRRKGPAWDAGRPMEEQSAWPEHAAFMDRLVDDGFVILGGPLADEERVVLVIEAESDEAVRSTLARDPWSGSHLLVDSVDPWTIRLDGRR